MKRFDIFVGGKKVDTVRGETPRHAALKYFNKDHETHEIVVGRKGSGTEFLRPGHSKENKKAVKVDNSVKRAAAAIKTAAKSAQEVLANEN